MTDAEQPAPSSSQADPDELAALFLKGRDIPCPNCGYNRRDGTGAECPECSRRLKLTPTAEFRVPLHARFVRATCILVCILAPLVVVTNLYWFVAYFRSTAAAGIGMSSYWWWAAMAGLTTFAYVNATIQAGRTLNFSSKLDRRASRSFRQTISMALLGLAPGAASGAWTALSHALS